MSNYAALGNVQSFAELLERVISRPRELPGMGVFYGWSGLGKTYSATYGAQRHRAYYLECGESWTKGAFCKKLLTELGKPTKGTVSDMIDEIIITLMNTDRPLIIDEFDHVVRRNYVETIREIHDKSGAPIVIIGEEMLPHKLKQWERFHNRILDWVAAEACVLEDAKALQQLYAPDVAISDDLMGLIIAKTSGVTRRVCVNLNRINEVATLEGLAEIDLATWGNRTLYTGEAPARRIA